MTRTKLYYKVRNYSLVLQINCWANGILFLECRDDPSSVGSNYYDIIKDIENILTGKGGSNSWGDYDLPNIDKPDNNGYPEFPGDDTENNDVGDNDNDVFEDLPNDFISTTEKAVVTTKKAPAGKGNRRNLAIILHIKNVRNKHQIFSQTLNI